MDYDTAINQLKEELTPFCKHAQQEGWAVFDMWRIKDVDRDLELEDSSLLDDLTDWAQDEFNCELSTESTDMMSYMIRSNEYSFDEWGNPIKKVTLDR